MTRAWRTAAIFFAFATLQVGAVLLYRSIEQKREAPSAAASFGHERLVPRPAPDLTLSTATGLQRRLSDYRDRPVLLHFWATWCPPCKAELPALLELGRELDREGGARVVALAADADWTGVNHFFGGLIPPEVARAETTGAAQAYDVSVLPDTYLIGADGRLLLRFGGARDWSSEAARALIRGVVPKPRAAGASPGRAR